MEYKRSSWPSSYFFICSCFFSSSKPPPAMLGISVAGRKDRQVRVTCYSVENIRVLHENNACLYREKIRFPLSRPTLCHKFLGAQPDMCAAAAAENRRCKESLDDDPVRQDTQSLTDANLVNIVHSSSSSSSYRTLNCCWARAQHSHNPWKME